MALILGIDTGGTYTDGVIIDPLDRSIKSKAKVLTLRRDLAESIRNCVGALDTKYFQQVQLVSISTTLATNAVVEGMGCEAGLITIGSVADGAVPTKQIAMVQGKFDIKGKETIEMDEDACREAIESFRGKVDSIAISGYASVRNPSHELKLKRMVQEQLNIPVVCAHELTSTLGFFERTVTSVLNAKLIPIIEALLDAIQTVLDEQELKVPIMVVKGDGSLMNRGTAIEKPIETILSGPVASVAGGMYLSDMKDALVIDMGGTTIDIAHVSNGAPKIIKNGAQVGGWFTRVRAAEIFTVGLGGDSHIRFSQKGELLIGPRKVIPYAMAAKIHPEIAGRLLNEVICDELRMEDLEYYVLTSKRSNGAIGAMEHKILEHLAKGPCILRQLVGNNEKQQVTDALDRLIRIGTVQHIALTPTDILHVEGLCQIGDVDIARRAARCLAGIMAVNVDELIHRIRLQVEKKITASCIQSALLFENRNAEMIHDQTIQYLIKSAFEYVENSLLKTEIVLKKPIIAIGAPSKTWLSHLAESLHTTFLVPDNADVANAIGAAVGQVAETATVIVRKDTVTGRFLTYGPSGVESFEGYDNAVDFGFASAREHVLQKVERAGGVVFDISESREEVYADNYSESEQVFVETRIMAVASGKPDWECK